VDDAIFALKKLKSIDLIYPEKPLNPGALMDMRRSCHLSLDEIATGAFHMVSLEAMCAGNIAINRADYFSRGVFASFCEGVPPPFQYADDSCISEVLMRFVNSVEETVRHQRESFEYFKKYCDPLKMIAFFERAYLGV